MDFCSVFCPTADSLQNTAKSLKDTLYALPCTLLLSGELGAGKTTFLQGWLKEIGAEGHVTSPTFALEQEYKTALGMVIHIDLYRLTEPQAKDLLRHSNDREAALRCIEWPERVPALLKERPAIRLHLTEEGKGRRIDVSFDDVPLPTRKDVETWRKETGLPANVIAHCDAVADFAETIAAQMLERGVLVRPLAVRRAAEAHDLLRFVDFRKGAGPADYKETTEEQEKHDYWRRTYPLMRHESACAQFLRDRGFEALATIVEPHGLHLAPELKRTTVEQKILFYADKRVADDRVVTVEERFADFAKRYGDGQLTAQHQKWLEEVKAVERELFPEGTASI